jgi:hypothetical protein
MSLTKKIQDWKKDQNNIFSYLKDNLGKNSFKLNTRGERCFERDEYHFKYQKCKDCHYIWNHLSGREKTSVPKMAKGVLFIEKEKGNNLYQLRKDVKKDNITIGKKIFRFYQDEFFAITNIDWYSTDNLLLNKSLVMMILRLYSVRKNFPLYVDFVYLYNCTGINFSLRLEKEYFSLEEFKEHLFLVESKPTDIFSFLTVKNIILQIIFSLQFFSTLFFTHNQLDYKHLRFVLKEHNLEYQKIKFNSSFKCIIFPSPFSSISIYDSKRDWWGRFFYQRKDYVPTKIPYGDFLVEINGSKNYYQGKDILPLPSSIKEFYLKRRIYFYRIHENFSLFLDMRRERGFVWGLNSFDFVSCLCSLMSVPYFFKTVIDNQELKRIWLGLWRKDEGEKLTKLLENKFLDFENVSRILKKFYIRFDALEYFYSELIAN